MKEILNGAPVYETKSIEYGRTRKYIHYYNIRLYHEESKHLGESKWLLGVNPDSDIRHSNGKAGYWSRMPSINLQFKTSGKNLTVRYFSNSKTKFSLVKNLALVAERWPEVAVFDNQKDWSNSY